MQFHQAHCAGPFHRQHLLHVICLLNSCIRPVAETVFTPHTCSLLSVWTLSYVSLLSATSATIHFNVLAAPVVSRHTTDHPNSNTNCRLEKAVMSCWNSQHGIHWKDILTLPVGAIAIGIVVLSSGWASYNSVVWLLRLSIQVPVLVDIAILQYFRIISILLQ